MTHRMRVMTASGLAGTGVLAVTMGVMPSAAIELSPPDEIRIKGTVRDFLANHPDFNITPADGYGHYAGNVDLLLGANLRPEFASGSGYKVSTQWINDATDNIPPHLYLDSSGGGGNGNTVIVEQGPSTTNSPTIDSFDSSVGPYGGANVGPAPTWQSGSTISSITPPSGLPYQEKYERTSGTHTISNSFECKEFIVKDGATVRISGDVLIRANEKVDIINQAEIEILANSSLTLWAGKDFQITDQSQVNVDSADPTLVTINYWAGNGNTFKIQNQADVYATIVSPDADLLLQDDSEFYGTFTGKKMLLQNGAGYHHDDRGAGGPAPEICSTPTNDTAGAAGVVSSGGITSGSTFEEWFEDTLGVNVSTAHSITLTRNGSGVYEYLDDTFYPIDNQLFGNEGAGHNYNFTFAFGADFEFTACSGMFFEFEGADDAWMFIGDDLAMDLGGVLPGEPQYVEIDRLNLVDGETYHLRFFYAQRNGASARFRLRTNLPLEEDTNTAVASGGFD